MNTKVTLKLLPLDTLKENVQDVVLNEITNSTYVNIKKIFILFFDGLKPKMTNWCIYVYRGAETNLASFYYYGVDQNTTEEEESAILNFEGVLHSEIIEKMKEGKYKLTEVVVTLLQENIKELYLN